MPEDHETPDSDGPSPDDSGTALPAQQGEAGPEATQATAAGAAPNPDEEEGGGAGPASDAFGAAVIAAEEEPPS